jgi:DNA polymerase-1
MKLVPPCGPTDHPLLAIVGEHPTENEERQGIPFVGSGGQLLNSMLQSAGFDRSSCYLTYVVKERPPNNDFGVLYEDPKRSRPTSKLSLAWDSLRQELAGICPRLIICLGAESLRALSGYSSIKTYRGTLVEANGFRIIPTYHPLYLLRGQYEERAIVEADLRKALRQALTPSKPRCHFITDPSFEECLHYLRGRPARISYDLETTKNLTRLFGFAWSAEEAISIPFMRGYAHRWTQEQEVELTLALKALLEDPSVEKVAQNAMYDNTIIARELGIEVKNLVCDTMLAQHLLYPELPKGLDTISSLYTDHPMYWGEGTNPLYNCYDCAVTYEASVAQQKELQDRDMWNFFQRGPMATLFALIYIQSRGVLIDEPTRIQLGITTEQEMLALLEKLKTELGEVVSPNSPKQVCALLYDKWKLPRQVNPKTKRVTADDDALRSLAKKHPTRAEPINDILTYRQKRVLKSTFIDMPLSAGRVYTSYNVAGTVTGRLSSSATIDGLGGNLQNIPRGSFRRIFRADPGKILIKADLSQAEYRVLIWRARIHRVIQRWTTEPDFNIHRWNASENIYGVPLEQVTKQMYSDAKNGVYAANYNVGYVKVSRMYNMEQSRAKMIITNYHNNMPEVKGVYQKEIEDELRTTRCVRNPLGRERMFLGRLDDETFRAAYSHYCQSTVGDLINAALVQLHSEGVDVLLQVHDELVCQCDTADVERTVEQVRTAMERPLEFAGVDIPLVIPADINVGLNWGDTMPLAKWKEQHAT